MAKSQREIDMQTERNIVMPFLQKYMFSQLFDKVEYVDDIERQLQGIDVIINDNGFAENIDVKAQASAKYINQPVPTFVQELLYTAKNRKEQIGWFLGDTSTDTYVYLWIHAAKTNERGLPESPEDIIDVEVMFVDKAPLVAYLDSKGYTHDVLLSRAKEMRSIGLYRQDSVVPGQDDNEMWLYYSADLAEKPVNLVIKKRVLRKFSTKHARITKTGIYDIANDLV